MNSYLCINVGSREPLAGCRPAGAGVPSESDHFLPAHTWIQHAIFAGGLNAEHVSYAPLYRSRHSSNARPITTVHGTGNSYA